MQDPEAAQDYKEQIMDKNEIDEVFTKKIDGIEDIVKIYPGSEKGPNPEDDPEFYSDWFIRNQPKELYNGENPDYQDIGVRW